MRFAKIVGARFDNSVDKIDVIGMCDECDCFIGIFSLYVSQYLVSEWVICRYPCGCFSA